MAKNKEKKLKRISRAGLARSVGGSVFNFLVLCVIAAFMVLPLLYVVSNAFKPLDEIFVYPPRLYVINPTIDNFTNLASLMSSSWIPFSRYIFNSVFITAVATFLQIIFASMAAYVLEKREFPGRKIFFKLVVTSLMFSTAVTAIPNYIIMNSLGIVNTYFALILPAAASSMGLYLMKQFMTTSIPNAVLEAARVDGANEFLIFWRIVMPLVKPAWLTLIIFAFQSIWATTGNGLIYSETMKPLNYALNQVVTGGISRTGSAAAVAFIMLLPPLTVFIISQSNILNTMASSGIKE
ncbi:MAG: carbohydrate ABC transporter permease [Clostridia bacterium]|nr:carbohydrate ABC transporter permease [Clostridia bacterium]